MMPVQSPKGLQKNTQEDISVDSFPGRCQGWAGKAGASFN